MNKKSLKKKYKVIKNYIKLQDKLVNTLKMFDEVSIDGDKTIYSFFQILEICVYDLIFEIVNDDNWCNTLEISKVDGKYSTDLINDLVYNNDLSFSKFKKEIKNIYKKSTEVK